MNLSLRIIWAVLLVLLAACQPVAEGGAGKGQAIQNTGVSGAGMSSAGKPGAERSGIALAELPPEARETLRAIRQGGPYAFDRDGVVFGNYERRLPKHPRGYYHEYTVKTPGVRTRGARRIISGAPGEYYYSADHYQTFTSIRE